MPTTAELPPRDIELSPKNRADFLLATTSLDWTVVSPGVNPQLRIADMLESSTLDRVVDYPGASSRPPKIRWRRWPNIWAGWYRG